MPGCDCENKNFQIAYDEQTSVVKQLHPDWSDRQVRIDVAQFLRPKFRQDLDSRNAERQGIEKSEPIEFELTKDGTDILFTKYGRTLSELNERTKTLTPEQYNPVDAITNAAIINAIKQGAGHIVTSYWRPNGENRDLLEITFNPQTGVGISRTINTETRTGKTHNYVEISDHAKSLFNNLRIQNPDERVFIATDISVDISQMQQAIKENDVRKFDAISDMAQSGMTSAGRIVEDVKETIASVIEHVRDVKSSESITESDFTNTSQDYFLNASNEIHLDQPAYTQSETIHSFETIFDLIDGTFGNDALIELTTTSDIDETTVNIQELWIQKASETLSISEPEASLLLIATSKMHEMFIEQHDSLQLVESLDVGHGAIFFALNVFTMTEFSNLHNNETIEEISGDAETKSSIIGSEFLTEQVSELTDLLFSSDVLEQVQDQPIEQQLRILSELNLPEYAPNVDFEHFMHVIDFIRIVVSSPLEQKIDLIKTEQKKSFEEIRALHRCMLEITAHHIAHAEKTHRYAELEQLNQNQSEESASHEQDFHIENFSLAVSFWMMIKLIQYVSALQKIETHVRKQLIIPENSKKRLNTLLSKEFMPENAGDIIQKEPAPWLLYAIIWHLAMIREHGFAQSSAQATNQQTKKPKNKTTVNLPIQTLFIDQSRVLYAYGS